MTKFAACLNLQNCSGLLTWCTPHVSSAKRLFKGSNMQAAALLNAEHALVCYVAQAAASVTRTISATAYWYTQRYMRMLIVK